MTHPSSEAKLFLVEAYGNMNRYRAQTQLVDRKAGKGKYSKGYEQHMAPESGKQDLMHIKFYNVCMDGHIFYKTPN